MYFFVLLRVLWPYQLMITPYEKHYLHTGQLSDNIIHSDSQKGPQLECYLSVVTKSYESVCQLFQKTCRHEAFIQLKEDSTLGCSYAVIIIYQFRMSYLVYPGFF